MTEETACNLCHSTRYKVLYQRKSSPTIIKRKYRISEANLIPPERIVKCLDCGLIFANPRIHSHDIIAAYSDMEDDESYLKEEMGRRMAAHLLLKKIKKFKLQGNKLLDIGCSIGFFLDEARKMGWNVSGVEISKWAVKYAKEKLSLTVHHASLEDAKLPDNHFDVVIMQDTIEHLLNPRETLLEIKRILKPGGIVYVNTPNIDSFVSRILQAKWWGINQFHLYYFSNCTLGKLLANTGFHDFQFISHERTFSFRYWMERFENYSKTIYGILTFISKKMGFKNKLLRINLWDQIGIFARKI